MNGGDNSLLTSSRLSGLDHSDIQSLASVEIGEHIEGHQSRVGRSR